MGDIENADYTEPEPIYDNDEGGIIDFGINDYSNPHDDTSNENPYYSRPFVPTSDPYWNICSALNFHFIICRNKTHKIIL